MNSYLTVNISSEQFRSPLTANMGEYFWKYNTVPQEYACGSSDTRQCTFYTGKGLGGGSAVNSRVYMRGNRLD